MTTSSKQQLWFQGSYCAGADNQLIILSLLRIKTDNSILVKCTGSQNKEVNVQTLLNFWENTEREEKPTITTKPIWTQWSKPAIHKTLIGGGWSSLLLVTRGILFDLETPLVSLCLRHWHQTCNHYPSWKDPSISSAIHLLLQGDLHQLQEAKATHERANLVSAVLTLINT